MGWIISIIMIIVMMIAGKEVSPDAYIIASSIFAVAGAIPIAARVIQQGRNENKKEQ